MSCGHLMVLVMQVCMLGLLNCNFMIFGSSWGKREGAGFGGGGLSPHQMPLNF